MKAKRAIVIGAGLGGLSAAAYLSKNGFNTDVFERNPHPGGYACSFVRGAYEFEASLHELSGIGPEDNRGNCYRMLDACGVAQRVEFLPIDTFYTSIFPDFTVTVPHGWEGAEEAYTTQFPDERKGIHRVLGHMRKMSHEVGALARARGPLDLVSFPLKGTQLMRSLGLTTAQVIDRELKDPRLKALFCNVWGYYGLPPSRLSWQMFALANADYIEHGPYHVKGTSQALSNAFVAAIEANGGRVHLRNGARRILTDGGKVTGIVADDGETYESPYVVSNANHFTTCYDLIGQDSVPGSYLKALAEGHIGISTFNVYMGLDCPAESLGIDQHEFFINETYDMDAQYRAAFSLHRQPCWVVTNYNHSYPEFSPPGTSVVVITCVADHASWTRVAPYRYVD